MQADMFDSAFEVRRGLAVGSKGAERSVRFPVADLLRREKNVIFLSENLRSRRLTANTD